MAKNCEKFCDSKLFPIKNTLRERERERELLQSVRVKPKCNRCTTTKRIPVKLIHHYRFFFLPGKQFYLPCHDS